MSEIDQLLQNLLPTRNVDQAILPRDVPLRVFHDVVQVGNVRVGELEQGVLFPDVNAHMININRSVQQHLHSGSVAVVCVGVQTHSDVLGGEKWTEEQLVSDVDSERAGRRDEGRVKTIYGLRHTGS